MKILFLSHYFPPEVNAPATRTYEHCKRWVEQGHEVTVISCVPHHPMGKAYPGYNNRWWFEENTDGIRAIKIKTYITANEGFLKRTLNYVIYMVMAILIAPFLPAHARRWRPNRSAVDFCRRRGLLRLQPERLPCLWWVSQHSYLTKATLRTHIIACRKQRWPKK